MPSPSTHNNARIDQAATTLHDLQAAIDNNSHHMRENAYLELCGISKCLHAHLQAIKMEVAEAQQACINASNTRIRPSPIIIHEMSQEMLDAVIARDGRRVRDDDNDGPPLRRRRSRQIAV